MDQNDSLKKNDETPKDQNFSNTNIKLDTLEQQKENGQQVNKENNRDNEKNEENSEIDEIPEEENEDGDDKNFLNKEEALKNPEENQNKIEKLFNFLRTSAVWRPIPTINTTFICLETTGGLFILIGIIILVLSNKIKEIEIRYDNNENCQIGSKCDLNFTIEEDMEQNVFVYYRLKNFYQNHRRYIRSKSNKQLEGKKLEENDIKNDCDPIILNMDIYEGVKSINNTKLDGNKVAHPCGLIAKSFFNDTFSIKKREGDEGISINGKNIAWETDKKRYKNSENYLADQWLNVEDERFMIWMRPAALPDFRKLWGRIEKDLNKGEYILTITNNYPVKHFNGEKYFILSTVNGLGGKNYLLAYLYLILGAISIIVGFLFWFGYKKYNIEKTQKVE